MMMLIMISSSSSSSWMIDIKFRNTTGLEKSIQFRIGKRLGMKKGIAAVRFMKKEVHNEPSTWTYRALLCAYSAKINIIERLHIVAALILLGLYSDHSELLHKSARDDWDKPSTSGDTMVLVTKHHTMKVYGRWWIVSFFVSLLHSQWKRCHLYPSCRRLQSVWMSRWREKFCPFH